MNFPRVALAAVVSWVVYLGVTFVVHGLLLADLYRQHAASTRPDEAQMAILPVGLALALLGFFAFAYAYAKGYEGGRGIQEGLRFGVIVGIILCCFSSIFQYMLWPASTMLLMAWLLDYVLEFALYGMIVGFLYRPRTSTLALRSQAPRRA